MGRFPHSGYGRSSRKDIEIIDQALERSGITHLASRMFSELSGGEASRVSFARVLAQQSSYLLLDEPTASLDPKFQSHILRMAQAEARAGAGGSPPNGTPAARLCWLERLFRLLRVSFWVKCPERRFSAFLYEGRTTLALGDTRYKPLDLISRIIPKRIAVHR